MTLQGWAASFSLLAAVAAAMASNSRGAFTKKRATQPCVGGGAHAFVIRYLSAIFNGVLTRFLTTYICKVLMRLESYYEVACSWVLRGGGMLKLQFLWERLQSWSPLWGPVSKQSPTGAHIHRAPLLETQPPNVRNQGPG